MVGKEHDNHDGGGGKSGDDDDDDDDDGALAWSVGDVIQAIDAFHKVSWHVWRATRMLAQAWIVSSSSLAAQYPHSRRGHCCAGDVVGD